MRKVHVEVEVEVLVPVRVKLDLFAKTDDDANISEIVLRWANRKDFSKAEIEDVTVEETLRIGTIGIENPLDNAEITEALDETIYGQLPIEVGTSKVRLLSHKVTDSR